MQVHLCFQGPRGGVNIEAVKRILLWLIVAAALVIAFTLYRTWQSRLDVTPDVQHEIHRAKQR
jgi:hypothetical protein